MKRLARLSDVFRGCVARAAFTLVEMLVVMAIISILAGILLPALNMARKAGRRTACGSNLKQIGTAMLDYSQTYGNQFPYHKRYQSGDWVPAPNASLSLIYPSFVDATDVFKCPTTDDDPTITISYTNPSGSVRYRHSWFGWAGAGSPAAGTKNATEDPNISSYGYDHRRNSYEVSSSTAVAADINDHYDRTAGSTIDETANHVSGANVLYLDTHVKWGVIRRINGAEQAARLSDNGEDRIYQRETNWTTDTDVYILLTYGAASTPSSDDD